MRIIIIVITFFLYAPLYSQRPSCHYVVKGVVLDSISHEPLPLTNIEVEGVKGKGTSSDMKGEFMLTELCNGPVELHVSHLQCEHIHLQFIIQKDTSIIIYLRHEEHEIPGAIAIVKGKEEGALSRIKARGLELQKGNTISELMQGIGGITLLKTGSTISKPMVNGLHSNRVILLNNGIRQEGQNWGLEHAPEIDAFLATEIELLKGAEALRYAADGVGGVIMIKPPSIFNEKVHVLKGEFNMVGNTNGRGGATSLILGSKISDKIPVYWRIQGTAKRSGNIRTPDYFQANTGMEELNYSAGLGYQKRRLKLELFRSEFYNKIGIFKGSQIGNIADLLHAFESDTPAVNEGFTYRLDRPYQQVKHILSKANAEWDLNSKNKLLLSAAYQQNHRQEYDIVRSATSYQGPDLNYFINTLLVDATFKRTDLHLFNFTAGMNGTYQSNAFSGRFFIPGFYSKGMAGYFLADKTISKLKLEAALRFDFKEINAYLWSGSNLTIDRLKFHNATYLAQAVYQKNKKLRLGFTTSSAWRPPAPNELYSNGLHQGLATIEIGDSKMSPERSFNQIVELHYADKHWIFETELYYKRINGFINLIPAMPPQITIRGAFPVYKYVQQDAALYGLNFQMKREFKKDYFAKLSANLMAGENLATHTALSQMPPLSAKLWLGRDHKKYKVQLWYQATARQFRYVEGSDYVAPPKGFALFGCDASVDFKIKQQPFKFNLSVNNLFNSKYREYLDRFRYFTNNPGFATTARLIIPLNFNNQPDNNK